MEPRIGIIGGNGGMGGWFVHFFQSNNIPVVVSDRGTSVTNRDVTSNSDIIILTVPMKVVRDVIDDISPQLTPHKLLVDICSLKQEVCRHMTERTTAELLSLHPMFGPSVTTVSEQVVVASQLRAGEQSEWLLALLRSAGARIVLASPEEHDQAMASVQGLNHVSTLILASVFVSQKLDVQRALEMASPIYRLRMGVIGRMLGQDPSLYADIAIDNPEVLPLVQALHTETGKWLGIIGSKDSSAFELEFKRCAAHFSEFLDPAQRESGVLIEALAKYLKSRNDLLGS